MEGTRRNEGWETYAARNRQGRKGYDASEATGEEQRVLLLLSHVFCIRFGRHGHSRRSCILRDTASRLGVKCRAGW